MKQFILQNKIFLSLYVLFLIIGGFIIAKYEKGTETLYFNSLHTPFFDQLFKWTTQVAELPVLALILIVAIRFGYGKGLILLANCTIAFIICEIGKHFIFSDQVRPAVFFEAEKVQLNFVEGVKISREQSFPSGHTTMAFALFFMLSILVPNKKWSILFFILALLVGISRVYLFEHFFRDIYAGSLIGVISTITFFLVFVDSKYYNNLTWKDKTLLKND